MTKLPEKNVLDDSKLPKTTIGEMKGALGKIGDYLNELLNVDSTDKETVRMAFKPDITGGKSIMAASCNTDIPVTFIEQRNQSIYGSDVNYIECGMEKKP